MKWIYILFVLITSLGFSQTWTQRASIPSPRWYPASVVLNGKIYVIGGQDSFPPYASISKVEAYDPTQNTWEIKHSMNYTRWGLMAAAVNGKIYAIGGRRGSANQGHQPVSEVEEYDPVTDTWITKRAMPTSRGYGGCVVFSDTIFVFGGRQGSSPLSTIEKYYPAQDTWFNEPSMQTARYTFAIASVNSKIYLIGGWNNNLVEEYNPITKTWATKSPMPTIRGSSGVGLLDGKIYVVGGRGGNSNEFQCYNPILDTWIILNPMPTAREGLTAAIVGDKLYAITGSVPLSQGGLPYYGLNEEASNLAGVEEVFKRGINNQIFIKNKNPVTHTFWINYYLPTNSEVRLAIYDRLGRQVKTLIDEFQNQGLYTIDCDCKQLSRGIYFLRLNTDIYSVIKKVVLVG